MFSFMKKRMGISTKKLKFFEETQEIWEKFNKLHNRVYFAKLSLKSLLDIKDEIKLQEMPPMLMKYCKLKGTYQMTEVLKSNTIIIKEDALFIEKTIATLEEQFGLEKKIFQIPNIDDSKGYKRKCDQFKKWPIIPFFNFFEEITSRTTKNTFLRLRYLH